ncbi:xanthine dehydrogenase family protein molybdopterin-binding subunit [Exilibacterium tricleocarpae]|uniref:Xanthine dehydrogenase family protein molybdopterin-binding subunit n=1 Tax=Exilibacterium tricleocarpae TaxID=2591008 RepID=A0A545SMC0_9GAMM|nr:molybdopterin cofactor-binding domain-containing protein [Exilibacterium tricleocarpae]TQV66142.1 xanthine dehydrogenase family protein molybdopterin-binding subunit [Exilibacterium tricleocarpae]
MNTLITSRRNFLKTGAAAGGGLVLAATTGCSASRSQPYKTQQSPADNSAQLNAWLHITPANELVFYLDKSEMGQGVTTGLPVLIAEELEIDPAQLQLRMAPVDDVYKNTIFNMQATGGSTSLRAGWELIRQMGAAARELLLAAAAFEWQVDVTELRAGDGLIHHRASGRSAPYGDFAAVAAGLPVPEVVTLKDKRDFKLIGKYDRRLDADVKVTGAAQFGIDTEVAGALVACVVRCPRFGGRVESYDAGKTRALPGVLHVLEIDSGVAVVADGYWPARQGAEQLAVRWNFDDAASMSSAEISAEAKRLGRRSGKTAREEGDVERGLEAAATRLSAEYELPYLAHATMEPMNCTASVTEAGCDVWAPTQAQGLIPGAVAGITGIPRDQVRVHTTFLGGGFGRRAAIDFVVEAVELSDHLRRPVKVVWSREDDMQHDFYRPMAYHRLEAGLSAAGKPTAWRQRIVSPSLEGEAAEELGPALVPSWIPGGLRDAVLGGARYLMESLMVSEGAVEGASDMAYAIDNLAIEYRHFNPGIPIGYWRSVGHSHTAFAVESFVDELAQAARVDPLSYRRTLLAAAPRHRQVLELAAQKAGWGRAAKGRHQGLAVHYSFGSYVAQVVEVSVTGDAELRVHRVVCAVDCGLVVNPDIVKAQMESGIVFGLTAALYGAIDIDQGAVKQGNFHDYEMVRINDCPEIEVHIVDSDAAPGGVGEPSTPPLAPALANAVYAATGQRLRKLPIGTRLRV